MALYVSLRQFEGPLDLLLHLITRAKVDIRDIFVSELTEQYLESMRGVDELDMDAASEFLAMAAMLLSAAAISAAAAVELAILTWASGRCLCSQRRHWPTPCGWLAMVVTSPSVAPGARMSAWWMSSTHSTLEGVLDGDHAKVCLAAVDGLEDVAHVLAGELVVVGIELPACHKAAQGLVCPGACRAQEGIGGFAGHECSFSE